MNFDNLFYFDIETVGKHSTLEEFEKNDKTGYDLFIKKIEKKEWIGEPNDIYLSKSPLLPEYGKIICVSMSYYNKDDLKILTKINDNESELVKEVNNIFKKIGEKTINGLCGYFIKGFDIPWLNRKFLKYDLEIPKISKTFNIKPWESNIVDLYEMWKNYSSLENVSFDEMLYDLNIQNDNNINGSNIHDLYWGGHDLDKIKISCETNVKNYIEVTKKIIKNI